MVASTVHQDLRLSRAKLAENQALDYRFASGRYGWLQVAGGDIALGKQSLAAGDGAALSDETELRIVGRKPAEILLFDLA